jgi:heptosyltransferase I
MRRVEPALPERVLIVRLGAIGDVVNALVLASALKRHAPRVEIGWAVHGLAAPLVQGHPSVDRVHLWPRHTGLPGFRGMLAEVRARRYGLAVDLQRIAKSAALARLSGAPRVLGFDRRRAKEASWLWTRERVEPGDPGAHMVEQYLEFARHLGVPSPRPVFELPRDEAAVAWAEQTLARLGGEPLLLNLGASKPSNRWEPERFGALAALCARRFGGPIAFTGGPTDREAAARALAATGNAGVADLTGATSLLQLLELQRRARAVVSCDTGPMHLAAAAGASVVALFGPADPRRTGPYGERHRVVRVAVPCAPCNLRHCNQARHACMLDLGVETVAEALAEVLARTPTR